ncbi:transcription initiation factor IIA large subunit-like isoform X2 [Diospyros lotus]|uniref:transcription initiation factor IIA large subunit-like isoform X2 n=1 Tax=Diospyros lotus TaxID=55363 RepID=UPI002253DAED|nr:transcription initiation factor IIA large subunit-like isoform X2 [Diospyros lotus]
MAGSMTSTVYIHVIEDVINKVRDEFFNNGGPGEGVLSELQGMWEMKMMLAGAILAPIDRSSAAKQTPGSAAAPVHDLNVPYEGTEEYETPTAEMLFPPTPMPTPLPGTAQTPLPGTAQTPLSGADQTPLPGTTDSSMYNIPTGGTPITPNDYAAVNDHGDVKEMKAGRPSPHMQPPSAWMNQRPPLGVDVNVAYVEGREELDRGTSHQPMTQDFLMMSSGKRKREDFPSQYRGSGYIPQQDGSGDSISDDFQVTQGENIVHDVAGAANQKVYTQGARLPSRISQLDGPITDPYDDVLSTPNIYNYQGVVNEDYNIASTPAPNDQVSTPAVVAQNNDVADDDEEEPLNENDDDDDLDDVDQGEELSTQHLVLAQFDKVTRTKSRWKCTLKDGIMHINNKDILFNKATGEFDF